MANPILNEKAAAEAAKAGWADMLAWFKAHGVA